MHSLRMDKENVSENLRQQEPTSVTPIKAISERGSVVKSNTSPLLIDSVEDKVEMDEDEEVKLPLDDFRVNGICATKEVNMSALAVVTPPDRSTTKGLAASFSPDLDVCKMKMGLKKGGKKMSDRALKPIPHVLHAGSERHLDEYMGQEETQEW